MAINTSVLQAYNEIAAYIDQWGYPYRRWYAGIAADARARLFVDHQVSVQGAWIYRGLATDAEAREVERMLFQRGCLGSWGGGDRSTNAVYAYLVTSQTNP